MLCADSITGLSVLQRFIQCISSYIYTHTYDEAKEHLNFIPEATDMPLTYTCSVQLESAFQLLL